MSLAPTAEIVHFLAVFHRALHTIHAHGMSGDRVGMVFGSWLANTVHNVPARLCHYNPSGWVDDRPTVFPLSMRQYAPAALAAECEDIFSSEHDLRDLRLRPDRSDLDLAPPSKLREYLNVLYHACLTMRLMSNYGNGRIHAFWEDVDAHWSLEADEYGAFCARLADVLHSIPTGLVHWSGFDEDGFRQEARQAEREQSERFQQTLGSVFRPNSPL